MALFGKLFSKETCAFCGAEVGMVKKRKLVDGVMCSDCEKKLSRWFYNRSDSTVAQIKDQLDAREHNRKLLEQFVVSEQYGNSGGIFVDDNHQWFCVLDTRYQGKVFGKTDYVETSEQLCAYNPDIIELDQVSSVRIDIDERCDEVKRTVDGEQVSYDPQRWRYNESFWLYINLDHPYIEQIKVNLGSVQIEVDEKRLRNSMGRKIVEWLTDDTSLDVERTNIYEDNSVVAKLLRSKWETPQYSYGFRNSYRNSNDIAEYGRLLAEAETVRRTLLQR